MKIKLSTVLDSLPALQELGSASGISADISYKISKTIRSCIDENKYYNELREKKAKELAEKDESGKEKIIEISTKFGIQKAFDLTEDNKKILENFVLDLRETFVEIWATPINISSLSEAKIRPIVLASLDWLIINEESAIEL